MKYHHMKYMLLFFCFFFACLLFPFKSILHRPLGPGMVEISKELIRKSLLRNPVGLVNLLGKCKLLSAPHYSMMYIWLDLL